MMRFFHPQMIAQAMNKPGPSIDQMIDFVLAGLACGQAELAIVIRADDIAVRVGRSRAHRPGISRFRVGPADASRNDSGVAE